MQRYYTKEKFKSKNDWLSARGLGGTSASVIMGKNPYMTKLELFKSITRKSKKDSPTNDSMIYGTTAEPIIRKLFAIDFPEYRVISPKNYEMYRRVDKPYLTATIDGKLIEKETKKKGILEIKTHDIKNSFDEQNWNFAIPDNYYIQCLHYLMVLRDFDFVILCAKLKYFDYKTEGGRKLTRQEIRYYYIDRKEKEKEISLLENEETKFYEQNVLKNVIPIEKIKF